MTGAWPKIRPVGLTGLLVSFADTLSDPANRAALAFRAAVEAEAWPDVLESSCTLASCFIRFDPVETDPEPLEARLADLLAARDWYAAPFPAGRRLWRIPCVFGGDLAPQLGDAAQAAGMSPAQAIESLSTARTRVLTLGFAPGMPYLGTLPPAWDLPRQTELTPRVPVGALVLAIRQFVLFATTAPTGWRHVGQTAFTGYRPGADRPFALCAGDEVMFPAIPAEDYAACEADPSGLGGATWEVLE
ncbi:putative allophanate hydrolase subunit 1 [Dinoroseobacter shibae DFL 12 = DSM 16493]|jgi:KipI family sensor histidine kinase inhibitor|uniref:Putative allophanate hydrolase subunit 1 n=1 Tax=Dinoroseobacter shibae (strain DSM 16493 / NCIMB 14021 / DFL 12) TaxID=398580 RepID=A8LPR3_DINSH|nr:allophanate hydrolase subunit 1 [Dinoroseobacter shibae]ABV93767.1 putative allophanate hydrolase subunit 1 [Dinoroseobacter shibae DFL 12 = DSM 16493]URF45219.1 allophanate hydrolase subunit 1 [Dinoroseobacter shibae]URF49524.1 allophanate hydrolase subunit 1 [Dinoroseobacter shibae]